MRLSVRRLGGVKVNPWEADVGGASLSLAGIFSQAGIQITWGTDIAFKSKPNGVFGLADLRNQIDRSPHPGWRMTLVLASWIRFKKSQVPYEPLGVMFDFEKFDDSDPTDRHREGCAVAVRRLEALAKAKNQSFDALCLRSIAHEMGHTFNLLHQPYGQGASVMHETLDLLQRNQLRKRAAFSFAADDRQWLTSGSEEWVRPGGADYRGPIATDSGEPIGVPPLEPRLQLRVSTRHDEYLPGEPVFLRVDLANGSNREHALQRGPYRETGALRVELRHEEGVPVVLRSPVVCCLAEAAARIAARGNLRANTPIHLDSRGLTLTRPGRHEVQAIYHDHVDGREVVVRSNRHAFVIREPVAGDGEVATLLRSDGLVAGSALGMDPGAARAVLTTDPRGLRQRAAVHHLLDCAEALARDGGPSGTALELLRLVDEEALDIEQRLDLRVLRAKLDGTTGDSGRRAVVLGELRELRERLGYGFEETERFIAGIHRDWRRYNRDVRRK